MRWTDAALALALAGCASPPDENACTSIREVSADGGYVDDASGAWISSPWNGPHILGPSYTTLRIRHGLGRAPEHVTCYASFSPSGGNVAGQIGNACTIIPSCNGSPGITADTVLFRNGGGTDFYYRFVFE